MHCCKVVCIFVFQDSDLSVFKKNLLSGKALFYAVWHMQGFLCALVEQSRLTSVLVLLVTILNLTLLSFVRFNCRSDGRRLMSPALFTLTLSVM